MVSVRQIWRYMVLKRRAWLLGILYFIIILFVIRNISEKYNISRLLTNDSLYHMDGVVLLNNKTSNGMVNTSHGCAGQMKTHPDNPKQQSNWHSARNEAEFIAYIHHICEHEVHNSDDVELCPCLPTDLESYKKVKMHFVSKPPKWELVNKSLNMPMWGGGHWRPRHCQARRRVAVIIPYRDRQKHLIRFLAHNINIFQKQLIDFRIFVVEQDHPVLFNKGSVMNAGYLEVRKLYDFDCVLFHDVDMLMENEQNIIHCGEHIVHHGAYVNKFKYHLIYFPIFGGSVSMTAKQFEGLNGYSNVFSGWGGEDDDLFHRVQLSCSSWFRAPQSIARFYMIHHSRDKLNPYNKKAWYKVRNETKSSYLEDGLNNVKYKVRQIQERPHFTRILLDLVGSA